MSLDLDFHTRVLNTLEDKLKTYRKQLEACDAAKHDRFCGEIAATKDAISVVNAEFQRMGGRDE